MPSIYNRLEIEMFRGQIKALKSTRDFFYIRIKELTEEINSNYVMMKQQGISREKKTSIYQKIQELKDHRSVVFIEIKRINCDLEGLYIALRM